MLRRTFISALGLAAAAPAFADTWPSRQIKVIVPYPPGGPTDISSRIVLEKAGQLLGQPILFDNKGGASGMLGAEIAKTQPADGYSFLATTVAMLAITRHLQPIPIDPDKDFATVARMSTSWMALAVHPSVPANTLAEFVAYVKANPGKVNFGSAGLAIVGNQRWPQKPDIPTMREQGYGKEGGESWYGLLAPVGTPEPIVTRMAKAIEEALQAPDVLEKLDKGGAKATYLGPAAMRAEINKESATFADIIKRGHVTLD